MGLTRYSRRKLKQFTTAIVIGEGEAEAAFLCYLKTLYCATETGVQVKVDWTYGGTSKDIIEEAIKLKQGADYSRAVLLLGRESIWPLESIAKAKKNGLVLIGSNRCIESLFLTILEPLIIWSEEPVEKCNEVFHSKYLNEFHKTDFEKYKKIFTIDMLNEARLRIPELNMLLSLITEQQI